MEVAALWLSFAAAAAAIASAIFTFVQAKAAVDARRDAKGAEAGAIAARDAAVNAQLDSAAAATRIAGVLERRAAAAQAAAEVRDDPWQLAAGPPRSRGASYLLTLGGKLGVEDVSIEVNPRPYVLEIMPRPVPSSFHPGESLGIYYARASGDARPSTLVVNWRWADGDEVQVSRGTLP